MFRTLLLPLLWAACLGVAMLPKTAEAVGAVGPTTLTLTLHTDAAGLVRRACPAIVVAPDVALTTASCFDFIGQHNATSRHRFDAYVEAPRETPQGHPQVAGVIDYALAPGYTPIDCDGPDQGLCQRAEHYCLRRLEGFARNVCRFNRADYARALREGPSHNVAVVWLNRRLDMAYAPLATMGALALEPPAVMAVMTPEGTSISKSVLRFDEHALWLADEPALATSVGVLDARGALAALPSHPATLPLSDGEPVDYVFSRIDAERPWLDACLARPDLAYRRVSRVPLQWLEDAATDSTSASSLPGEAQQSVPGRQLAPAAEPALPGAVLVRRSGCGDTQPASWACCFLLGTGRAWRRRDVTRKPRRR